MLDDASAGFLGMPFAETVMMVLGLALLAIAARAAIHALDSLSVLVRRTRAVGQLNTVFPDLGLRTMRVVLGIARPDISDDDYRTLLWAARKRVVLCFILFAALIAGMTWFSGRP